MTFERIPSEMRTYPHWVLWRYVSRAEGKPTKLPFSPSGVVASVTDSTTWATFDEAIAAHASGGFDGIGFVFTANDPFAGIDLDDADGDDATQQLQNRIFDAFDSYAELSPSGRGLHIIVRGNVAQGRRRGKVEVYSTERFFTMTGNVYRDAPIADHADRLAVLWSEMAPNTSSDFDPNPLLQSATETDEAVFNRAASAANGDKFTRLWNGDASDLSGDTSGSAIDQALVNILAFYTKDPAQIERLWLRSPQGQRDKTQHRADYRQSTIRRAFDRTGPALDFSHLFKAPSDELPIVIASELQNVPVKPRLWHVDQIIPARTVTYFGGAGGTGKSQAALQLSVGTVLGRAWFGVPIMQPGGALFVTAEDDMDEVHRRLADIVAVEHVPLSALDRLAISSLAGLDALMATPGPGGRVLVPTAVYAAIRAYVERHRPSLVVLDTLADLFGGDEVNRAQVRQFIAMLRAVAIDFGTTVVLLAHPSVAGMKDDSGISGSTAWSNSVRSRLYMKHENEQSDVRIIEVKKANYGAIGQQLRVKWERGAFVLHGNVGTASEYKQAAQSEIDALFLELLGEFEARSMVVSPQWQSRTRYVAKLMADHPKANGVTATAFYDAMVRLIASGRVEERVVRIDRRDTRIIATVPL